MTVGLRVLLSWTHFKMSGTKSETFVAQTTSKSRRLPKRIPINSKKEIAWSVTAKNWTMYTGGRQRELLYFLKLPVEIPHSAFLMRYSTKQVPKSTLFAFTPTQRLSN